MTIRIVDGQSWQEFNNAGFWEPVPKSQQSMRISHQRCGGGFELWVYRYVLGDLRNCIGWFRTFKQAARKAETLILP